MSEWVTKPLSGLSHLHIGGTPSRDKLEYWAEKGQDGFPWVSIADLKTRRIYKTKEKITKKGATSSNTKLISKGTLIMSFKLSLGKVAIADRDLYTNEAIVALPPISNEVSAAFLYFALPEIVQSSNFDTAVKGATLNKEKLRVLEIRYPSCQKEQKAITATLNALDTQIEQTKALIAKQENIRQGLMQDLFTRGLDETGQLRPAYKDAPHLYHKTELGWLPLKWKVKQISDVATKVTDGDHHTPIREVDGIYLLSARNVENGFLKLNDVDYVGEREYQRMIKRCFPEYGDILISCSGTVGRVCMVPKGLKCVLVRSAALVKLDQRLTFSRFLFWALRSEILQTQIKNSLSQAAQPNLFQGAIVKLAFPSPDLTSNEVEKITNILDKVDEELQGWKLEVEKLQKQKAGLMRDLLSGEVSVAPLMEDETV